MDNGHTDKSPFFTEEAGINEAGGNYDLPNSIATNPEAAWSSGDSRSIGSQAIIASVDTVNDQPVSPDQTTETVELGNVEWVTPPSVEPPQTNNDISDIDTTSSTQSAQSDTEIAKIDGMLNKAGIEIVDDLTKRYSEGELSPATFYESVRNEDDGIAKQTMKESYGPNSAWRKEVA